MHDAYADAFLPALAGKRNSACYKDCRDTIKL